MIYVKRGKGTVGYMMLLDLVYACFDVGHDCQSIKLLLIGLLGCCCLVISSYFCYFLAIFYLFSFCLSMFHNLTLFQTVLVYV